MPSQVDHDGPLVLLVDDDPDLLELSELVLAREGLRIVTARDGRRALAALDSVQPDVIVTDLMMPEVDGLAFLKRYADHSGPIAPVIAVSAFVPYLEQARALGATATLPKPYDPKLLASMVRAVADGHRRDLPAPQPAPEQREDVRQKAILELNLDVDPELGLRPFLDQVAAIYDVPVAGLSAVTAQRQKLVEQSSRTDPDPGGPREDSFCTHAVAARAALVVQDASRNPLFQSNPSVTQRGFCFYAGVPLMANHGEAVGTLCLLDFGPRHFSHWDLELLGLLARRVLAALEQQAAQRHPDAPEGAFRHLHSVDDELDIFGKDVFTDLVAVQCSRGIERNEPVALVALAAPRERLPAIVQRLHASGGLLGRLGTSRIGWLIGGMAPEEASLVAERASAPDGGVATTPLDRYEGAASLALLHVEEALGDAGR